MSTHREIDRIANEFEVAWQQGLSPKVADFVEQIDPAEADKLIEVLIPLDLTYCGDRNDAKTLEQYAELGEAALLIARREIELAPQSKTLNTIIDSSDQSQIETSRIGFGIEETIEVPAKVVAGRFDSVSAKPKAGEKLDRFEILRELGHGGMGAVYLAHDPKLDRKVAIKIPFLSSNNAEQILSRFQREARAVAALNHPNICPVHEITDSNGLHFMVMAYIEGRTLASYLGGGKQLKSSAALKLTRKLAITLDEAHRKGVVHRDLKPANIMIDLRNEPQIMDFGLARLENANLSDLTKTGQIIGTPAYMSPEQVSGNVDATGPSSDIYSLGVILYQMLSGCMPHEGELMTMMFKIANETPAPLSTHREKTPRWLDEACAKALAKKPEDRFESMRSFADALVEPTIPDEYVDTPSAEVTEPTADASHWPADLKITVDRTHLPNRSAVRKQNHAGRRFAQVIAVGAMIALGAYGIFAFTKRWTVDGRTTIVASEPVRSNLSKEPFNQDEIDQTPAQQPAVSELASAERVLEQSEDLPTSSSDQTIEMIEMIAPEQAEIVTSAEEATETRPALPQTDSAESSPADLAKGVIDAVEAKLPTDPVKSPIPSTAEQAKAKVLVLDVFEPRIEQAKTPETQSILSKNLATQAETIEDNLAARYVMLVEARRLAVKAANTEASFQAIDSMQRWYEIDPTKEKLNDLDSISKQTPDAETRANLCTSCLGLAETAIVEEKFETALELVDLCFQLQRGSTRTRLRQQTVELKKEIQVTKEKYANFQKAQTFLENNPVSANANYAIGQYLCFYRRDWDRGLDHLAVGSSEEVRRVAELDLKCQPVADQLEAEELLNVGDSWWDLSSKTREARVLKSYQRRAQLWYLQALPGLPKLLQVKVERKLNEVGGIEPPDPKTEKIFDKVSNAWAKRMLIDAGGLLTDQFALCQTLPLNDFKLLSDKLTSSGYRPARVSPFASRLGVLVAAIWERDGRAWRIATGSPSDLAQINEQLSEQSYIPVDIAGYSDGTEKYLAIWAERDGDERSEVELQAGVLEDAYYEQWNERNVNDFQTSVIDIFYAPDGSRKHSFVWSEPQVDSWKPNSGSRDNLEDKVESDGLKGRALCHISMAERKGFPKFFMYSWICRDSDNLSFHNLEMPVKEQLFESERLVETGYHPLSIDAACLPDGQILSSSVWEKRKP